MDNLFIKDVYSSINQLVILVYIKTLNSRTSLFSVSQKQSRILPYIAYCVKLNLMKLSCSPCCNCSNILHSNNTDAVYIIQCSCIATGGTGSALLVLSMLIYHLMCLFNSFIKRWIND